MTLFTPLSSKGVFRFRVIYFTGSVFLLLQTSIDLPAFHRVFLADLGGSLHDLSLLPLFIPCTPPCESRAWLPSFVYSSHSILLWHWFRATAQTLRTGTRRDAYECGLIFFVRVHAL